MSEVYKEYTKNVEKITLEHITKALDYIIANGKLGSYGIYHVYRTPIQWAIVHKEKYVGLKDTLRVAYLYAIKDLPEGEGGLFSKKQLQKLNSGTVGTGAMKPALEEKGIKEFHDFNPKEKGEEEGEEGEEESEYAEMVELLDKFKQIILHGPPGTGKTYSAKKILESLFEVSEKELRAMRGENWNIIQFHPSYNYEDFVRGIKVETMAGEQIKYETENRVFGKMCKTAAKDPDNSYALIIDEINRANVSAVLGELIYALEYRGESVETPYAIDGNAELTIPENLYIIGTMNNADRTIGQIDYAVRRRFSFVPCPPDREVIEKKDGNAGDACSFFDDVKAVFKDISQDFESDDVCIGHSYFLAKDNKQLACKILYQVVPILREYVKDGVLLESAKSVIDDIEKRAKKY